MLQSLKKVKDQNLQTLFTNLPKTVDKRLSNHYEEKPKVLDKEMEVETSFDSIFKK
jgi:hypothetical protein